jgi:enoyl-CoA hydratase/carnithine racemase
VQLTDLKVVRYEVDARVATVTLDRPERLNAWTGRMHTEYRWALAQAEADPEVRAVVVTGAGRGFCAGADTAALDGHVQAGRYDPGTPDDLARPGYGVRPEFDHAFAFHYGMRLPVIAAVNGPAAGVGLVLACFCDIRFAAEGAKFTTAFARRGLVAEHGISWVLPRLVGPARALDLLLSGRVLLAEEAAELGLVNRAIAPDALLDETLAYARDLAANCAPSSMAAMKLQVYRDLDRGIDDALTEADRLMAASLQAPDFVEGVSSFLDRRAPEFAPLGDRATVGR